MTSVKLAYNFINAFLSNPRGLLKSIYHFTENQTRKNIVTNKYGLPHGLPYIDLLTLFPDFSENIVPYSFMEGTSRVTDMALLKLFGKKFPNGRYIELGTWRGESIANISEVMQDCVSISFSEDDMRKQNFPESAIKASRMFSLNKANIKHIKDNTQTYNYSELKNTCDLIFVDADHHYKGVKKDTQIAFELLKNKNSIIVWHDASYSFEDVNWEVQAGILDGAPDEASRKKIYRVSNTLCSIYTNQEFSPFYPEKYNPNKVFEVSLTAKKISA